MKLGVESVLFGLALAIIVLAAEFSTAQGKPFGSPAGIDVMRAAIEDARKVADHTDDGATIEVSPIAGQRMHVEVHRHRPTPTSTVDPTADFVDDIQAFVSLTSDGGNANGAAFVIFVSPHNAASAAAWTPAAGALAAEPACVNPIALTFMNDGTTQVLTMSCTDASISESQVR